MTAGDPAAVGLETSERVIPVEGRGKTRAEAFEDAMRGMRKALYDGPEVAILQAEPVDIKILRAREDIRTEKFFGVLFPRKVSTFHVAAEVTVSVKTLDLSVVDFASSDAALCLPQRILTMS